MAAHLKLKHDQAPPDPDNSTKIQPPEKRMKQSLDSSMSKFVIRETRKEILAECAVKDGFPMNAIRKSEVNEFLLFS